MKVWKTGSLAFLALALAASAALAGGVSYGPFNGKQGYQDIKVDYMTYVVVYHTPVEGKGRYKILINPEPYNFYRVAELAVQGGFNSFVVTHTGAAVSDSHYTVSRTVTMSKGAKVMGNAYSFDAHQVLASLGPMVTQYR